VLSLACDPKCNSSAAIARAIAVGFPTVYKDRSFLDHCTAPRIFVQSTHDQFGPVDELEQLFQALPEPKQLFLVEAQDHFFAGALDRLEETIFSLNA